MAVNASGYPGIYNASPITLDDGQGAPLAVNANGELLVNLEASSINIGNVGGDTAHDVADVGNPVKIGGKGVSAEPAAVTANDRVNAYFDLLGYQHIMSVPDSYAVDDSAMPATPKTTPISGEYRASATTYTDGDVAVLQTDINGNLKTTTSGYALGRVTADGQIKGSAGFLHTLSIAALTATPTAGLITIYDSLTETGTVIYAEWIFATDVGHTITLDVPFGTGLYVGYDATLANVQATLSYR